MYFVRRITLRGRTEVGNPQPADFSESQWRYLTGQLDPHPGAEITVCVWRVLAGWWMLPPEYLAELRRRLTTPTRTVLVIEYRYSPDDEDESDDLEYRYVGRRHPATGEPLQVAFGWRLERHWLVEWADTVSPARRPPILFAGSHMAEHLIGGELAPALRPAYAALLAFSFVTSDEIAATYRHLRIAVPPRPELSRALSYFSDCGLVARVPEPTVREYWRVRGESPKRHRVFASLPNRMWEWTGRGALANQNGEWGSPIARELESNGLPAEEPANTIDRWERSVTAFREYGLKTV